MVGALSSGHGTPPSRLDTFVNRLGALSSVFSTKHLRGRTADGGLPAEESRLNPVTCLIGFWSEIPGGRVSVVQCGHHRAI
jgi:hypothetical protein